MKMEASQRGYESDIRDCGTELHYPEYSGFLIDKYSDRFCTVCAVDLLLN